ncbi:hypothetical protein ACMFMG_009166 [Clarireedia jacksonii]
MPPYHGLITAGLRNNRRMNAIMPPNHINPVKRSRGLPTRVIEMIMSANQLSRNLPGIHHQAREMGNRRIDIVNLLDDSFEHLDDYERLSEAALWVYACIVNLEHMHYAPDPFGLRITAPSNPFAVRMEDVLEARALGDYQLEHQRAEQLLHLFQAVSDILQEDRRHGAPDGCLVSEFLNTAAFFTPYISRMLQGPGMLLLLRAVATMSGHDEMMLRELIRLIPREEQRDLYDWAWIYWQQENMILGLQIVEILG